VPVRNEAPNVVPLVAEVAETLKDYHPFELIFVDDGSDDGTGSAIKRAIGEHDWVRAFRHEASCGQSAAQRTAIHNARAPIIVTIDGDGQNDPADIPRLLEILAAREPGSGLAMVAGQRMRREDHMVRRLSSRIANGVRRSLLKDGSRDVGCGLKAFDRDVYLALPYFDHLHRFYPALVRREGLDIAFVDVGHRRRWEGQSKYGVLNRLGVGIVDLLGMVWLLRRRRLPQISEY
jgi:glycosyltransferase involved in cell wall biosynthesis